MFELLPASNWEVQILININYSIFNSVQFSRWVVSDSLRPHGLQHARPPCPSPTPGVHSKTCPSSRWCHPAISSSVVPFSSCPQSPNIRVFSNESTLRMRWPRYWSFSFSISPSNEHPGLICFRMDWLDLLAVQGTLKSLLQHHCSKASILQRSAFFTVQLSHPYRTTEKTIALSRRTFVGKVMSLLFNILPRLVITFLPRSKHLLISWLQSPSAVILEPPKINSDTVSILSYICFCIKIIYVNKNQLKTQQHTIFQQLLKKIKEKGKSEHCQRTSTSLLSLTRDFSYKVITFSKNSLWTVFK